MTSTPPAVDRAALQAELDRLRLREKAHTREGDAIAAARRWPGRGDLWTTLRGVETMDNSYALMDLTVYGRQEGWEDSPAGWPQQCSNTRTSAGPPDWPPVPEWPAGRPLSQWPRLDAGLPGNL
jgi:predicted dithiol-disulfide oxidoreductase (DUF899 family)